MSWHKDGLKTLKTTTCRVEQPNSGPGQRQYVSVTYFRQTRHN